LLQNFNSEKLLVIKILIYGLQRELIIGNKLHLTLLAVLGETSYFFYAYMFL